MLPMDSEKWRETSRDVNRLRAARFRATPPKLLLIRNLPVRTYCYSVLGSISSIETSISCRIREEFCIIPLEELRIAERSDATDSIPEESWVDRKIAG